MSGHHRPLAPANVKLEPINSVSTRERENNGIQLTRGRRHEEGAIAENSRYQNMFMVKEVNVVVLDNRLDRAVLAHKTILVLVIQDH